MTTIESGQRPKAAIRGGRAWLGALRALACSWLVLTASARAASDLKVGDGVVVKFGEHAGLVVRDKLSAGSGVTLTSVRDASIGGGTDASGQAAAAGDWLGVRFERSAAAFAPASLDSLDIRYAGGGDGAALLLRGSSPTLRYLQIRDSTVGLRLRDGAAPSIDGASFLRNTIGVEVRDGGMPTIVRTQFSGNRDKAVLNAEPEHVIQATGNWWGDASGPSDPVANPQGRGDAVSEGVAYGDFLNAVPLLDPTVRLAAPATFFDTSSVALELSCVNATEFRVAEDGDFTGVAFHPMDQGRAAIDFALSPGDGSKSVQAQFRAPDGRVVQATLDGGVLVDTQAPTVRIVTPAAGSLVRDPITLEADADDASGVASVAFFLGDQLLATDIQAPYAHAWDTDAVADGSYTVRVVATDKAGRTAEQSVGVTVSHAAPTPDTEGPQLSAVQVGGSDLADGANLANSAVLTLQASDRSAISRIDLLLDGTVAASAHDAGGGAFSVPLDLDNVANGAHTLALQAVDSLGNTTTATYAVTVAHAPPSAPVITQPAADLTTRNPALGVAGTSAVAGTVQLLVDGEAVGDPLEVGADGRFTGAVALHSGSQSIQAVVTGAYGTSGPSVARHVTLDTSVPNAPSNLAVAVVNGALHLTWNASSDPNTVGYEVYRAVADFTSVDEAQKVASVATPKTAYDDLPDVDGTYYYRVVAVNAAGAASPPTASVHATLDRTEPFAERIEYQAGGAYDAATATYGRGTLDIDVTVSEPLLGIPYLSVVPEGGLPMPVDLVKRDDTHYHGVLTLGADAGSGVANVLFSARDLAGNRGVDVHAGATLHIDTVGPELTAIDIEPAAPIRVDVSRDVTATFTFGEAIAAATPPALQYQLSGASRSAVALGAPVRVDATHWKASFQLPEDAGRDAPEQMSFAAIATDALGNTSSRITAANLFQVYQGDLPALPVPLGLSAQALPGGKVQLVWQAVDGADAYQVFRQGPQDTQPQALSRTTSATLMDATPADGLYSYTVASIRISNGQETQSGPSPAAQVRSLSTAPGAPQNLQLSLASQGVVATWQPPVGSTPASYRLYRAPVSIITSVDGLTPVKQGIRTTQTVDATPSQSEHAYVVTAVDAAGNESAISNSVYLNFDLLPVRRLEVEQIGTALPKLSWLPNGDGAVGFDVYVGEGEQKIKLTAAPTATTQLTDTGYTGGERRYTVETVDANDARIARSITLPEASEQVVGGLPLKRNVMNRLDVQVSNLSSSPVTSAHLEVTVAGRTFRSEAFVLDANATRVVPVVIGGFPDLPNPAAVQIVLQSEPNEGEIVRLGWTRQVDVVDSALVVGIEGEDFVRRGSGKVRLTVENTSDVEVELLTARNGGRDPSNELRLKLLDKDGNPLGTTPYYQATGAGVITLAGGQTVARIAPGQRYVSDVFEMPVPATAPDQVRVRLDVDKLRYHTGEADQVAIPGVGSERTMELSNTPYYGEISSAEPVVSYGNDDIVIQGRALDRDSGGPVPNAPLKLAFDQEGFERLADVTTDAEGAFRYVFKPTLTDSGEYRVGAIHPDMTDRPDQARFTVNRIHVDPSTLRLTVPRNYPYRYEYRATAGTGSQAHALRLVYAPQYQPSGTLAQGVTVDTGNPIDIGARQDLALPITFTGDNTAAQSGHLVLAVVSDSSGAEPLALLGIDYGLTDAKPAFYATPNYIQAGLSQGQSKIGSVVIENKGFVAMNDVVATLVGKDGETPPAWVSLASNPQLGSVEVGAKRSIDLNIAPDAQVAEGVYQLVLRVSGSNLSAQDINVFVSVTQSGQGNVLFKAADIYTATRDKNGNLIPGVNGARVFLQNEAVVSQTYEMATDAYGEAFFQNLPAGSYRFKVSAQNHQDTTGRVSIQPGLTANQSVFLEYTLISVEWSVREVTIEDRYEIDLNATFETDVPAPVVVLQPTSINLPKMEPGEVFQGELTLTNYGLIRADDVVAHPPSVDGYYKFEFLAQPPTSLEAKQRVRLPYRIIALGGGALVEGSGGGSGGGGTSSASLRTKTMAAVSASGTGGGDGANGGGSASGSLGCYTYSARYPVTCKYTCANGVESTNCGSSANWFYVEHSSCPAGTSPVGSSSGSGGTGGSGGGGWGGSGGPSGATLPGLPLCTKGTGDCYEPKNKQSGGGNEGGQ